MLAHCQLDPLEDISVKSESKYNIFSETEENDFNIICKLAAILPRPKCVNKSTCSRHENEFENAGSKLV